MSGARAPGAAGTAYERRQAILDASPEWRFRIAVERFERSVRNVEVHIHRHGSAPMPDALWAEAQIARRELMAFDPGTPGGPARSGGATDDGGDDG